MSVTLNIALPVQKREIMEMFARNEMPKYTFIKEISPIEVQYEVEDDGTHGDLLRYTKKLIRSSPFGSVIMFRVLYNGQFFEGDKIHEDLKK